MGGESPSRPQMHQNRVGEEIVIAKLGARTARRLGESLELALNCDAIHLFDPKSGVRLPAVEPADA